MLTLLHPSNSLGEFHLRSALAFFSSSRTVGVVNSSFPTWCQSLNPKIFGRNAPQHSKEPGEATVLKVERKELLKIRKKKKKNKDKLCNKILLEGSALDDHGIAAGAESVLSSAEISTAICHKKKNTDFATISSTICFSMHQFCGFWFIFGG